MAHLHNHSIFLIKETDVKKKIEEKNPLNILYIRKRYGTMYPFQSDYKINVSNFWILRLLSV